MDHSSDVPNRPDGRDKQVRTADYEVGYGKPPKHSQFQPGKSGNPKGRPKGAKSLKGHLLDQLNQKITIKEGGRSRNITIREAIAKRMAEAALRGDLKTIAQVLALDASQTEEAAREGEDALTSAELVLLEEFLAGSAGGADQPVYVAGATGTQDPDTGANIGRGMND